ncbi:hypothetical protein HYO65_gp038 [Tenacibaculum phage PTm1]|uniref:Uncharacterized protein n=2 Tax=Shirahamavirus PTm1 TaxID=2846435 RepID=A0A5S9EQY9_9CAUD|nr:hypothetical protein HYO65_gp038 [Tenacibaculum phage PTm1]BBI90430.1 hypothetical protein [Tenacibaculum phage PTm1]BBI90737.1 hypothetical protein [Tenacibaculum phage PTm5]
MTENTEPREAINQNGEMILVSPADINCKKLYDVTDTKKQLLEDVSDSESKIKALESKIGKAEQGLVALKESLSTEMKTMADKKQEILDLKPVEDKLSLELVDVVFAKDKILPLVKKSYEVSKKLNGRVASITYKKLKELEELLVSEPTKEQLLEKSTEISELVGKIRLVGTIAQAESGKELVSVIKDIHGTFLRDNYKPVLWKSKVDLDVVPVPPNGDGSNSEVVDTLVTST